MNNPVVDQFKMIMFYTAYKIFYMYVLPRVKNQKSEVVPRFPFIILK